MTVSVPLTAEARILRENAIWLALAALASTLVLAGLALALVRRLSQRLAEAEAALVRMATTDELTDLKNRRFTMERLHEELVRARRERHSLGVLSLDLDHFKHVNDTLGHPFGDEVLHEAAERMRSGLREYDIIGRVGGEEFLVVAPEVSLEEASDLAERVRAAVSAKPVEFDGTSVTVTVSTGVTTVTPASDGDIEADLERVLKRADDALYAAKDAGRNRVVARPEPAVER